MPRHVQPTVPIIEFVWRYISQEWAVTTSDKYKALTKTEKKQVRAILDNVANSKLHHIHKVDMQTLHKYKYNKDRSAHVRLRKKIADEPNVDFDSMNFTTYYLDILSFKLAYPLNCDPLRLDETIFVDLEKTKESIGQHLLHEMQYFIGALYYWLAMGELPNTGERISMAKLEEREGFFGYWLKKRRQRIIDSDFLCVANAAKRKYYDSPDLVIEEVASQAGKVKLTCQSSSNYTKYPQYIISIHVRMGNKAVVITSGVDAQGSPHYIARRRNWTNVTIATHLEDGRTLLQQVSVAMPLMHNRVPLENDERGSFDELKREMQNFYVSAFPRDEEDFNKLLHEEEAQVAEIACMVP